jgi:hypothetical protein
MMVQGRNDRVRDPVMAGDLGGSKRPVAQVSWCGEERWSERKKWAEMGRRLNWVEREQSESENGEGSKRTKLFGSTSTHHILILTIEEMPMLGWVAKLLKYSASDDPHQSDPKPSDPEQAEPHHKKDQPDLLIDPALRDPNVRSLYIWLHLILIICSKKTRLQTQNSCGSLLTCLLRSSLQLILRMLDFLMSLPSTDIIALTQPVSLPLLLSQQCPALPLLLFR